MAGEERAGSNNDESDDVITPVGPDFLRKQARR